VFQTTCAITFTWKQRKLGIIIIIIMVTNQNRSLRSCDKSRGDILVSYSYSATRRCNYIPPSHSLSGTRVVQDRRGQGIREQQPQRGHFPKRQVKLFSHVVHNWCASCLYRKLEIVINIDYFLSSWGPSSIGKIFLTFFQDRNRFLRDKSLENLDKESFLHNWKWDQ